MDLLCPYKHTVPWGIWEGSAMESTLRDRWCCQKPGASAPPRGCCEAAAAAQTALHVKGCYSPAWCWAPFGIRPLANGTQTSNVVTRAHEMTHLGPQGMHTWAHKQYNPHVHLKSLTSPEWPRWPMAMSTRASGGRIWGYMAHHRAGRLPMLDPSQGMGGFNIVKNRYWRCFWFELCLFCSWSPGPDYCRKIGNPNCPLTTNINLYIIQLKNHFS